MLDKCHSIHYMMMLKPLTGEQTKLHRKKFSLHPTVPQCLRVDHDLDCGPPTSPPPPYQTSQVWRNSSPSDSDRPGPLSSLSNQYAPDSTQREEEEGDPLVVSGFSQVSSRTRQMGKFGTVHHLPMIEAARAQGTQMVFRPWSEAEIKEAMSHLPHPKDSGAEAGYSRLCKDLSKIPYRD